MAKYWVNYRQMNGGWMREALYALTGLPIQESHTTKLDAAKLWTHLSTWDRQRDVITADVSCPADQKHLWQGLICGHAYTVLGVATYKGEKLVKARNPWRSEGYKGTWSDKDTGKWTAAAKTALKHTNANDGAFFIPINDFKKYFKVIHTAITGPWKQTNKQTFWDRKSSTK